MNDELLYMGKRFLDLSRQANRKGIVTFSDFLSLSEQAILQQNAGELVTAYELFGGYEYAERQMAAFIPDALFYAQEQFAADKPAPRSKQGEDPPCSICRSAEKSSLLKQKAGRAYPFKCLHIIPSYPKFAEKLTHRDVLGALMSLGAKRSKLGDLIVDDENIFVFAEETIVPYIVDNLSMVRHTAVTLEVLEEQQISYEPNFEEKEAIVTSNRLDAVIAAICKTSRSASRKLITDGKIFVNGAESLHNTYYCKQGDVLSIRGFGKVRFGEILGTTKKDRLKFSYKIYS